MAALIDAARAAEFPAEIALVFSNVETAQGLKIAAAAGVATKVISHKVFASRAEFDAAIDAALTAAATAHRDYVTGETLATGFDVGDSASLDSAGGGYSDDVQVEGLSLKISLRKA